MKVKRIGYNTDNEMMFENKEGVRYTELELRINNIKYEVEE